MADLQSSLSSNLSVMGKGEERGTRGRDRIGRMAGEVIGGRDRVVEDGWYGRGGKGRGWGNDGRSGAGVEEKLVVRVNDLFDFF